MTNDLNTYASQKIRSRIKEAGGRYWAGDNISQYIEEGEHDELIEELSIKFEGVLQSLVIDTDNDPNSMDTARRLAKMYVKELMVGRYDPMGTWHRNRSISASVGMPSNRANVESQAFAMTRSVRSSGSSWCANTIKL